MVAKNLYLGISIMVGLLALVGTVVSPTNLVWAATILCPGSDQCIGTDGKDNMVGDNDGNAIRGLGDNDLITGKGGVDALLGDSGDDTLNGNDGNDQIVGAPGSDLMNGGSGNDQIFHLFASIPTATDPDGSRDRIDCGTGIDEAWINVSVDHDIAANCETVHTG